MGTAILRSHDCLQGRFLPNDAFAIATSHARSRRNSNPNPNFNHNRRRKRSPVAAVQANSPDRDRRRSGDRSAAKSPAVPNLSMGQVKILKRGEKLGLENNNNHRDLAVPAENRWVRVKSAENLDLLLCSTDRLGPDPLTVQKQVRVSDSKEGIYAGSAFVASPHPSSVPVPGFIGRNGAATSDLRRLLRLDLE